MTSATPVAVAVPVRNEAGHLPGLLDALAAQRGAPPFTLCLFFDACDDGSEAVVADLARHLPFPIRHDCTAEPAPPHAGRARARAMTLALSTAPDGIVMTTDADGAPAPDWIAANLAGLALADLVCGRVVRHGGLASPGQDRVEAYQQQLHRFRRAIDPVPWEAEDTHGWTSGASLAMPAPVYLALGGFPARPSGEDGALGDAAARAGYRTRRDARVVVRTSARRQGRAPRGYAAALAGADGHLLPAVTHPGDEAWRFRLQAEARRLHASGDPCLLARPLGLDPAEVARVAAECRNGEAFAARIVGNPPGGLRMVTLPHAELLLASLAGCALEGAA